MRTSLRHSSRRRGPRDGFTMAELLLAMAVIAILFVLVLPTIGTMFGAGSLEQAEGVIAATFSTARALAIDKQTPVLVHFHVDPEEGKTWLVTMVFDPTGTAEYPDGRFVLDPSVRPERLPGDVGAGGINTRFGASGSYESSLNNDKDWADFTTFNVVFGPDGALAADLPVWIDKGDEDHTIFWDSSYSRDPDDPDEEKGHPESVLFHEYDLAPDNLPEIDGDDEGSVRALILFNYKELAVTAERDKSLDESAFFLVINPYTGQFVPTKVEP